MATRGSDRLQRQLGTRCSFDEGQLQRVLEVLRENDLKIVDWECKGQPQPDFFSGTVEVDGRRLGKATEVLGLGLGERVKVELFPYGIPVPDIFRLRFESLGHGG
ncbi:MAG TPA: hypothetical protein VF150_04770 [Thermoanaerobaculia bacterium]